MLFLIPFLLLGISNVLTSGLYAKLEVNKDKKYNLDEAEEIFVEFIKKYAKKYESDEEYKQRLQVFKDNLNLINEWNKDNTAEFTVNPFSDITHEEFKQIHGCINLGNFTNEEDVEEYVPSATAPDSLDWRAHNLVTPVKNQLHCGSCYVFSAIAAIEGQHAKLHQQLISLSEQQGLDCNPSGCDGGIPLNVMNSLVQQGGSMPMNEYPYEDAKNTCRTKKNRIVVKVAGGKQLGISNEESLKSALAEIGPLAINIYMSAQMTSYHGGIFMGDDCGQEPANHSVTLVGYGAEGGVPFWIIKNSWGMRGEAGYIRLVRGRSACQIGRIVFSASVY